MNKKFNSIEEIKKYYDKKTNTYIFKENNEYIEENNEYIDSVVFNFDLNVEANIVAIDANGNRWHIGGVRNDK